MNGRAVSFHPNAEGECPECLLSRVGGAGGDRQRVAVDMVRSQTSARVFLCGENLVALEDMRLDSSVAYHCCGVDRSLWLVIQVSGTTAGLVGGNSFELGPGQVLGMIGPGVGRKIENAAGQHLRRVTIKLGETFLARHLEQEGGRVPRDMAQALRGGGGASFLAVRPVSPYTQVALQQLLQNPYPAGLGVMFAESRALAVACDVLDSMIGRGGPSRFVLSAQDTERVHHARDLLMRDVTAIPPTINCLARQVGINEFKLKKGFRELFGVSIYACHRNARMDLACRFMVEGRLNVCEVACAVGYSNPSHFSRAFRERFQISPGAYLRDVRSKGYHSRTGRRSNNPS